jgi:hypothetical protein
MRRRLLCLVGAFAAVTYNFAVSGESMKHSTTGLKRLGGEKPVAHSSSGKDQYSRKINLVYRPLDDEHLTTLHNQRTRTPAGWEQYDGSAYTAERGYGWLTELRGSGRDRGMSGTVFLPGGEEVSLEKLSRPELASFHHTHLKNDLLVFRIDIPDGWYRVSCASVDAYYSLPLVDQRSIKCRAHDVVFAGADVGAPIVVGGKDLVEGSKIVEVTDGHLRVIVGDPAYSGWTYAFSGPWYRDLKYWWRFEYNYANSLYQWFTRTVDPGFHSWKLNYIAFRQVAAPASRPLLIFRDFFNRDDSPDLNTGVPEGSRWSFVKPDPKLRDLVHTELYKTSIKVTGTKDRASMGALLQQQLSPAKGITRYSTRVSLYTGEGSRSSTGSQEAGIVLLADASQPSDFDSTFVGVRVDNKQPDGRGRVVYRVGDGGGGFRTNMEIPDTHLPFEISAGEFEIIVEHDMAKKVLKRVSVNGFDITDRLSFQERTQRLPRGLFGVRSVIQNTDARVSLRQFYWYYRLETLRY